MSKVLRCHRVCKWKTGPRGPGIRHDGWNWDTGALVSKGSGISNAGKHKTHMFSNMILKTPKTFPEWNKHHSKWIPNEPNGTQRVSKCFPGGFQMEQKASRRFKRCQDGLEEVLRGPQEFADGAKRTQDGHQKTQDGPKMAPKGTKIASKKSQNGC